VTTYSRPDADGAGRRKSLSQAVLAALWTVSNGRCYAPDCVMPVVLEVRPGVYQKNSQVAHIYGIRPGTPRYRPDMPAKERDSFAKLLLLCKLCRHKLHTIVVPDTFRGFDHTEMIDGIRGRLSRLVNTVAVTTADAEIALDADAWVTLDQLRRDLDPADPAPDRPSDANDVMRIAFTSGTTGEPKAVMHTANTTLSMTRRENEERGIDGDATILVLLPAGLNAGFGTIRSAWRMPGPGACCLRGSHRLRCWTWWNATR
jgi:hypothetical protein